MALADWPREYQQGFNDANTELAAMVGCCIPCYAEKHIAEMRDSYIQEMRDSYSDYVKGRRIVMIDAKHECTHTCGKTTEVAEAM